MKVLLLCYAFPPVASAEAYVAAKCLKDIPGVSVDVISLAAAENGLSIDTSLNPFIIKHYNVLHRIKIPEWSQWFQRNFPRTTGICFRFPDIFHYANRTLIDYIKDLDIRKYDAIMSRSQWHSVHLAALHIKKANPQIPWLAHFSDPWADNELAGYTLLHKYVNLSLEKEVFLYADHITVTSEETKELMAAKYPVKWKKKISVIPHCYDDELYDIAVHPPLDKYVIRSIGSFYGRRSPAPFFNAVDILVHKNSSLFDNVVIEFVGLSGRHKWIVKRYRRAHQIIKIVPNVSYIESLKLMRGAQCLLSIEAPTKNTSVFFPSKLVDYAGAERHILSLSSPGSSWKAVNELGGTVANINNTKDIVEALERILVMKPDNLPGDITHYSQQKIALTISNLLKSLVCKRKE